jgi:aspartyl-tRNA(Asn)/glutamyl-tRNA(Gln) amidotransferase subunit B
VYQSFVYLEVRILLSDTDGVFFPAAESSSGARRGTANNSLNVNSAVLSSVTSLARALDCTIPQTSVVEKLTGTLPVPPEGKKLTGYSLRVGEGGRLNIMFHALPKTIHIEEVRLEEDCGRLTHSAGATHMDYTFAGCPSVRLRTTHSFELGEEAELFLDEVRRLVSYLNLVNVNASDGGIRCNAYAALSEYPLLPDYSIKLRNLNSFNFVRKAINAELSRQEGILESGGTLQSESRLWNERQNTTEFYQKRSGVVNRFVPVEPKADINLKNDSTPCTVELPETRRVRLRSQYGLSRLRAEFICDEKARADFFEAVAACGANPLDAAHWMASELTRNLNIRHETIAQNVITPEQFATIIKMFEAGKIHSGIAKQLIHTVMETGKDPASVMKEQKTQLLAGKKELLPYIQKVIAENENASRRLQNGEMANLEYLTGQVMKKTGGMAEPQTVKALIKKELKVSIVYVVSFGGAISAVRHDDGSISSGDTHVLRDLLAKAVPDIPAQVVSAGEFLSEELEPRDWGRLTAEIASRIDAGTASGIVITHGTDTLSYTAALMYWLFGSSRVPVVLTASTSLPGESSEAADNIALACRTACSEKSGVYVAFGGKVLSPLNLKFMKPTSGGFANWNLSGSANAKLPASAFVSREPIAIQFASFNEPDGEVMARMFEEAAGRMSVCRLYPGFRSDMYGRMFENENDLSVVFLELYDTGTANMRNDDYSLKPLFLRGKSKGCRFYCTSQQECTVNLSQYVTSKRLWREGAVPMGTLTTESAVALYFAASLIADNESEIDAIMEEYAELYAG